jgi:hypothetical protein
MPKVVEFISTEAIVYVYNCLTSKPMSLKTQISPANKAEACVFHFTLRKMKFREVK